MIYGGMCIYTYDEHKLWSGITMSLLLKCNKTELFYCIIILNFR